MIVCVCHRVSERDIHVEVASGTRLHTTHEEASAACAFSAALFADIAALPAEDAEAVLRYMFQPA